METFRSIISSSSRYHNITFRCTFLYFFVLNSFKTVKVPAEQHGINAPENHLYACSAASLHNS